MASTRAGTKVPYLPGVDSLLSDATKTNFAKSQKLTFRNGEREAGTTPRTVVDSKPKSRAMKVLQVNDTEGNPFHNKVLRWTGYFTEGVKESPEETYRVRVVKIFVYLEDDTIQVDEVKSVNSGIPQGTLLKRVKVSTGPKSEDFLSFDGFSIGGAVDIFGRHYEITDADGYTRSFMAEVTGSQLGGALPMPSDPYTSTRRAMLDAMRPRLPRTTEKDRLRQFLENDRKVLRYYAVWDDSEAEFGDSRKFVVNYYLANDTVEVLEVIDNNSGRDPWPVFMKRGPLPKTIAVTGPGTAQDTSAEIYSSEDFQIGTVISVYNRSFLLYDADEYTKGFLTSVFGVTDFPKVEVPTEKEGRDTVIGSDDSDPGANFLAARMEYKPDFYRLVDCDGKVLRFRASLKSKRPIDSERAFVVSFWLADETISVYEPPIRNSGIQGGQFLRRTHAVNPESGSRFLQTDFYTGASIKVHSHEFLLGEADEYALKWMESRPEEFPQASLDLIRHELRAAGPETLASVFEESDADKSGCLSGTEFGSALRKVVPLTEHQVNTVLRSLDADGNSSVSYQEFLSTLAA